jgi:hypothetical protein
MTAETGNTKKIPPRNQHAGNKLQNERLSAIQSISRIYLFI